MFGRIYRSIFRWSYKKIAYVPYIGQRDDFLISVGLYVQHVQSNKYARKMRTAMLWSAASALYLWWGLDVGENSALKVWGLELGKIKQENILFVLFVLTGYYTTRLLFLVIKAVGFVNPFFLILPLYGLEPRKDPAEVDEERDLHGWLRFLCIEPRHAVDPPTKLNKNLSSKRKGEMKCADQVRFMVKNPTLGLLENFFFPVLVIPVLCTFVVVCLALQIF